MKTETETPILSLTAVAIWGIVLYQLAIMASLLG